ncbi:hypothetical protein B0H13DRAFT_2140665 [Mycena leptocephala]|nr:hypothetical protein B0H13DRAFT_2140665 [Mycena leptocephala]
MTVIGSVTYSTGVPTFTGVTQQTGTGTDSGAAGSGGKHGLPSYVSAIIGVVGAFSLLALLLFGIRRRAVQKRAARNKLWSGWAGRDSGGATAGNSSSTRSIRSSFGTTFDHSSCFSPLGVNFPITFDDNVPLPPMAEIRGGPSIVPKGDSSMSGNGQPLSPISPISQHSPALPIPLLVSIENSNVYSDANRRTSTGSSASAQYISYDRDNGAANHQMLTPEVATPITVRPFSPSESFTFPSPPREHRSSAWITATTPLPQITETLTVWRPFEQTLQDEMTVVLAVYDDGWAMIERVGMGKGKGKAQDGRTDVGLIPIDCMRKAEESVSSFLAAKRVSSVDATGYTAMAV